MRGDEAKAIIEAVHVGSCVSLAVLVSRLGRLRDTRMREICAALAVAVDCSD